MAKREGDNEKEIICTEHMCNQILPIKMN